MLPSTAMVWRLRILNRDSLEMRILESVNWERLGDTHL